MQLIIDIPEEVYKASQIIDATYDDVIQIPLECIANGTPFPLPKGHGRLIDADRLKTHFIGTELGTDLEVYLKSTIMDAPTIIEADKAESEDKR